MSRRAALLLAAVAACGGASGSRTTHTAGHEYLAALRIEGNKTIPAEDLLPGLSLERNAEAQRSVDDYQLQLDKDRITTAYQKLGFFSVEVHSRIEHQGDAARVVFTVNEGARATVQVEITGLPAEVPFERARALVKLRDGGPFDYDAYDDAKDPLELLVEDAGYAHAHVTAAVIANRVQAKATVRYSIDAGPICTFGAVTLVGAEGMLADSARARISFAEGEHYSTSALQATQNALYAFGRFATVRVVADRNTEATTIPVRITVARGDLNELRFGVGGGIDPLTYFGRVHLAYSRVGVITPLTTFAADLRPEYALEQDNCTWDFWHCKRDPRVRLLGTLTQQDLWLRDVKGDVELGVDYLTVEAYTKIGAHTRLGITTPLGTPRLQARVSWTYAYSDFYKLYIDPSYAPMLGIDHSNYVGAYNAAIALDLRDKPVEPRLGVYADVRVTRGTRLALGDFEYWQATPEVRIFLPLGETVLALRARIGAIWGDVPETERYYAGGMSSHRGFGQRRLSPSVPGAIDPNTMMSKGPVVVGGAALVETSVELRRVLGTLSGIDFGGVLFLDGGDVTGTVNQLDVLNQHWAVGAGLNIRTPIGPVGIDVGYRLNRNGPGEPEYGDSRFNFVIAVGEAF